MQFHISYLKRIYLPTYLPIYFNLSLSLFLSIIYLPIIYLCINQSSNYHVSLCRWMSSWMHIDDTCFFSLPNPICLFLAFIRIILTWVSQVALTSWSDNSLLCVWICPIYCEISNSIPGLCSLVVSTFPSSPLPPMVVMSKIVETLANVSRGSKLPPLPDPSI